MSEHFNFRFRLIMNINMIALLNFGMFLRINTAFKYSKGEI